jgi:hypothetical protein
MSTNLDRFRDDLKKLVELGHEMSLDLTFRAMEEGQRLEKIYEEDAKRIKGSFETNYQKWYTDSHSVLNQLLPDRLEEFAHLYRPDPKRKRIDGATYRIQDWLTGSRSAKNTFSEKYFNDFSIVRMQFKTQLEILESVQSRFESSLHDMAQILRADLFDSELDSARELAKNGFLRGAGAIAGVVLEKHLGQVCQNHNVPTKKQHPTISDFNDLLKNASVIDVPVWRQIQRLGDIRNLCDHNKHREPTKEEVSELVEGVEKTCKTLF